MATGRIGTTPVLQVRWSKAPSAGTTSLSGLDDNSVSLVYSVGYEAVYRNGVLLSRTNDYTATDGTTVTLIDATIAGDIIEIFANQTIPLADTYSQTVANGKFINNTLTTTTGDIIYASAANTPARLGIGSTGQVLKVSGGVPSWGADSGALTLISTTTFSNVAAQNIDSVFTSTYTNYTIILTGLYLSTGSSDIRVRLRASGSDLSAGAYIVSGFKSTNVALTNFATQTTSWSLGDIGTRDEQSFYLNLFRPNLAKDTTGNWFYNGTNFNNPNGTGGQLAYSATTVADGIAIYAAAGNVYGTISIYGWSK